MESAKLRISSLEKIEAFEVIVLCEKCSTM